MTTPTLTMLERSNIDNGPWFAKLSPALQHDILERSRVRRLRDGDLAATRGAPAQEWCGVAAGAVRISSVSLSGKQVSLTYVEPGTWFGDIALFDGLPLRLLHHGRIFGGYDNIVRRSPRLGGAIRRALYAAERTPFAVLGLSHFLVLEKQ